MDSKYVLPLIGVVVGWLLTSLSSGYRTRTDNIKSIGILLAKLIRVHQQLRILITTNEHLTSLSKDWRDYERLRKGTFDRHFLEPAYVQDDLNEAINNIAPIYPLLAVELEGYFALLLKNKAASLDSFTGNSEAYMRMLSVYEAGLKACDVQLQKTLIRLAAKHGLTTLIRLAIYLRKSKIKTAKSNAFLANFITDVQTEMERKEKDSDSNKRVHSDAPEGGA